MSKMLVVSAFTLSLLAGCASSPMHVKPPQVGQPSPSPQAGHLIQFKSVNYPDRYIRHRNYLGELTPLSSDIDKNDSIFIMRPGLNGKGVSFESINFPGFFLRHQNYQIKLHKAEADNLYKSDASFIQVKGPVGGVAFESVNYPGHFIRHCSSKLWIDNNKRGNKACNANPNVFSGDVSFDKLGVN